MDSLSGSPSPFEHAEKTADHVSNDDRRLHDEAFPYRDLGETVPRNSTRRC